MNLRQFNRIVEIRTKIISISSFLSGSLYAAVTEQTWSWPLFGLMFAAVLLVDMGTTGFNSYFDFISGTDVRELNTERDKVLVHDGVSPSAALGISLTLFSAAGILGIIIAWMTSWTVLAAGGISMVVGFAYTGGPLPISRTPAGELFAGGFLGSLLFTLSFYIQSGSWDLQTLSASLPFLILIAMILTVNNTCDREADIRAGRRTLSILAGKQASRRIIVGELAAAYLLAGGLIITGIYPFFLLPFLVLSLPFSIRETGIMSTRGYSLDTKGASMGSVSKIFLAFSMCFIFGNLVTLAV